VDTSKKSESESEESATRRIRTLDEKLKILAEAAKPGASVALVARKHEVNANLVFAWRRLQRRGLLEERRHAPPLLPVKITEPTLTPTRRSTRTAKAVTTDRAAIRSVSAVEIAVGEQLKIRLEGEAERLVLARLLEWLPRR
jgi:transposase